MKKYFLFVLYLGLSLFFACSSGNKSNSGETPEIPTDPNKPGETIGKPVQIWIDAHANFSRFASKENIKSYLEKIKSTGFNEIYLDVKPGIGYALYNSDILPKLTKWGNETVTRDWDYLAYWIEEAEKLDVKVIASLSTLGFGDVKNREGLIFDGNRWDGKTQMRMDNNNPDKLVDMRDEVNVDAAFLNPCIPEVQTFVISIIGEIAQKYPKLKGICLDYCRWWDSNHGMSDVSIAAFEAYSGEQVTSRNNIITASGGVGTQFQKWIEFRAMTITNLVTGIRTKIKSVNPKMELHVWASANWAGCYSTGQNWASKKYTPTGYAYTGTYNKTGYADQLDVFSLGAYAEAVWKKDNPNSVWSVENFVMTYNTFTMGDCKVNGSINTPAYGTNSNAISDAVYLCLKNTDGLMVFDITHVINFNQWAAIKDGIGRVIKK